MIILWEWDIVLAMLRFILTLIFVLTFSYPNSIIEPNIEEIDTFLLEYYHDKEQKLNINSIQNIEFNKKTSNRFNFGYLTGDIWFKLTLDNQSENRGFIFYLTESFFNEVNFFKFQKEHWQKESSGLSLFLKNGDKKDINPLFNFTIEPHSQKTFYIQFHTKPYSRGVSYGKFKIFTQKEFRFQTIFNDKLLYIFYFGTLTFIMIFNLFLFIVLKDSIYIYYTGYIFFTMVYILSYSGFVYHLGLASWIRELNISVPLLIIFFTFFSTKFLNTKLYLPLIDKILTKLLIFLIMMMPLIIFSYDPWFNIINNVVLIFAPLLFYASIYIFIKGHTTVKYYILALIVYLVSLSILCLMTQGLISNSDVNHYALVYGSYFEIVFFSFVLAKRFYKIQREIILIKVKNEQVLETKVKNRTIKITELLKEKELLLKEVYHRVKNNFQMVIGLLWIEASSDKNSEHKQSFLELIGRIKSMSMVHQYLLDSNTYAKIESEEYLLKIIEETEQIYSKKNIHIEKEIDHCTLDIDQAMALSVIVNEVLTNAVKHHNQQTICDIQFSFKKENENIRLSIEDNGLGFTYNEETQGFGLKMIKQFSKKLKSSNIKFNFKNGTEFMLSFKL